MKITRKEVLKAIRTERLKGGDWIHKTDRPDGTRVFEEGCAVCAVGGVLRGRGLSPETISSSAWNLLGGPSRTVNQSGDEFEALAEKNYLAALSIKFEKLYAKNRSAGPATRQTLVYFVKRHFPKTFNTVGSL